MVKEWILGALCLMYSQDSVGRYAKWACRQQESKEKGTEVRKDKVFKSF